MTCQTIMTPSPVTVRDTDAVDGCIGLLLTNRFVILPVLDSADRYIGSFGVFELLRALLPRGATIDDLVPEIDFIAENLDDLRARLDEIRQQKVGPLARKDLPVLRPDTPILEALLLFHRNRTPLPVVEKKSNRLLGIVSYWDALATIADRKP